jgi:NTE family protein
MTTQFSAMMAVYFALLVAGSIAIADDSGMPTQSTAVTEQQTETQNTGQVRPGSDRYRPRIGLVLSGGGARGAAHVGVIQVLEEMNVPIDFIAGTSMGAIVGGLYASGMSTAELETTMATLDWADAFRDQIDRRDRSFRRKRDDDLYLVKQQAGFNDKKITLPTGLIAGQKIDLLLKSLTISVSDVSDFDELRYPFRAVATDIVTGEVVVLGSGDLAMAMRSSMNIPAAFALTEVDGKLLVDGGVSNNLPIDVVRQMGADIVIAVDISTPLQNREKLTSVLSVTEQLTGILTRTNTEAQIATLTEQDLLILPDLGDIATADFERAAEAIPIGVAAAHQRGGELQHLALSAEQYDEYLASHRQEKSDLPIIDFVRIENNSRLGDKVLAASLNVPIGQPLDVNALEEDIGRIYGWQLFQNVRYDLVEDGDETGLVLHVDERPWGPNYLQAGLAISNSFDGDSVFNLGLAYTRTGMNAYGGELRIGGQTGQDPFLVGDFYQPLGARSRYFIHPRIQFRKRTVNVFDDGNILSELRISDSGLELAAGRNLSTRGEIRLGLRRLTGDVKVRVGDPTRPDVDFDTGQFFVRLSDDKIDNVRFPSSGHIVVIEGLVSRDGLGADTEFEQLMVRSLLARPIGKGSVLLGLDYNTTIDSNAPVQSLIRIGGLLNLSGFAPDELAGQHSALLKAGYLRKLGESAFFPFYVGGSLELGNVWQNTSDISASNAITAGSLLMGADSVLGPIYMAYGRAEGGVDSVYLFVGKLF